MRRLWLPFALILFFCASIGGGSAGAATADITQPAQGAVVRGSILVLGTAHHEQLERWSLHLGGTQIASGTGSVFADTLGVLITNAYPDGESTLRLEVDDTGGGRTTHQITIVVDNTPPVLNINAPADGDLVSGTIAIAGTVQDANLYRWTLDLPDDGGAQIAWGATPVDSSHLAAWNTALWPDGLRRLRLVGSDLAGNISATLVQVETKNAPPHVSLDLPTGYVHTSGTTMHLAGSVSDPYLHEWWIDVETMGTVLAGSEAISGNFAPIGLSGLAEGEYLVSLTAADHLGNAASDSGTLVVDRTPPLVGLSSPRGGDVVGGVFAVSGLVSDPHFASWQIMLGSTVVAEGNHAVMGGEIAQIDSTPFEDGAHLLRIRALDHAGNVSGVSVNIVLDNTPPLAAIAEPSDGAVAAGSLAVVGSVSDAHLVSWRLTLGGVTAAEGVAPVPVGTLAVIDTSSVVDGPHMLRLEATDKAGNLTAHEVQVVVDNTPPSVAISVPTAGLVQGSLNIHGTVDDAMLAEWKLTVLAAGTETVLASGESPLAGQLAAWNTALVPDGEATLTLSATDSAGNSASTEVVVTIDNLEPVVFIKSPVDGAHVSWTFPVEAAVFDASLSSWTLRFHNANVATGTHNFDGEMAIVSTTGAPEGPRRLRLRAVDNFGRESETEVTVVVDRTPPSAAIHAPNAGAVVAGNVPVQITATDANLEWWTIHVDGTEFTLSGTNAVSAAPVGHLPTMDWEDGAYTVVLTVRDKAGNVTTSTRSIVVDNSPPAILIDAPAEGSVLRGDVDITGHIDDAHGISWSVALASGATVAQGTGLVGGLIGTLATGALPDGEDELVISAVDVLGNEAETRIAFTVDNTPPTVAVTSPPGGAVVANAVELSAELVDASPLSWSINVVGGATLASGAGSHGTLTTTFSTDGLLDGPVSLELVAVDAAGNVGSDVFDLVIDRTPPAVHLDFPGDGSILSGMVSVFGSAQDVHLESWSVELTGELLLASGTESVGPDFLASFDSRTVSDGTYTLRIEAVDAAGHMSFLERLITIDNGAPAVFLYSPSHFQVVGGAELQLVGTVRDPTLISWTVHLNGTVELASGTNAREHAQLAVVDATSWPEGEQVLTLSAVDWFGRSNEVHVPVRVDNSPPVLDLSEPQDGSAYNGGMLVVQGSVSDAHLEEWRIFVNAATVAVGFAAQSGTLATIDTSNYADGSYELTLWAVDAVGHETVLVRTFHIDTVPPAVSGPEPPDQALIADASPTISVQTTGAHSVQMWLGDQSVPAVWDGDALTYTPAEPLPEGVHTVRVHASDALGNEAELTWSFSVDTTPPVVAQFHPTDGATVSISHGTVFALISGYDAVWLEVDGDTIPTNAYSVFSGKLVYAPEKPFAPGPHTVVLTLTDAAGNVTVESWQFTVESRREGFGFGRLWFY